MKTDQSRVFTKRRLYLVFMAFVISVFVDNHAYSQTSESEDEGSSGGSSPGFIWGGKAGATLNQFNQPGTMVGLTAGLVGSYEVTDYFTPQIELLYTMSGGGRADASRTGLGSEVLAVHYQNRSVVMQNIEVPLMLFFTLSELNAGPIVPRFGIGVSYAYCMAAFENHDKIYSLADGTETILGNRTENILSDIEVHQFAFNVGLAIDYKLEGGKVLGTEMRYKHGLNDVNLYKTTYTGSAQFPTTLSLALSLKF